MGYEDESCLKPGKTFSGAAVGNLCRDHKMFLKLFFALKRIPNPKRNSIFFDTLVLIITRKKFFFLLALHDNILNVYKMEME